MLPGSMKGQLVNDLDKPLFSIMECRSFPNRARESACSGEEGLPLNLVPHFFQSLAGKKATLHSDDKLLGSHGEHNRSTETC